QRGERAAGAAAAARRVRQLRRGGHALAAGGRGRRPGGRDPRRGNRVKVEPAARALLASCSDVDVVYGAGDASVHALVSVSLEVGPGERVALLGRSGWGKTTLLHVLGGLVEPAAGEVAWQGEPLSSLDHAARGAVRAHGIAY